MEVGHVIPEAIRDLLEKRGTFQEWLAKLDELGSEFRPEVADKVRGDYATRLADVEAELGGHRAELETALAERLGAVEKVALEHDARSAELEETQLRHVVGEFDDDEWETRRAGHQGLIDELETELTEQRAAVESLQVVLGELAGSAAALAARVVAADTQPEVPEPEEPEPVEVEAEDAWMTRPFDEVDDDLPGADEAATVLELDEEVLEIEEEVEADEGLEEAAAETVEDVGDEVRNEPAPDDAAPAEFMDELEFLESLSLDDADNFDAVSAMLDEDEGDSGSDEESRRETGDL